MTPALFLPSNTRATGLIVASSDAGAVAYAATTRKCGSQPDAVWAMDLADAQKPVTAFKVGDATIAGAAGPSIGRDGTVYIATAAGTAAESSSVFALEPKTLKQKGAAKVAGRGLQLVAARVHLEGQGRRPRRRRRQDLRLRSRVARRRTRSRRARRFSAAARPTSKSARSRAGPTPPASAGSPPRRRAASSPSS